MKRKLLTTLSMGGFLALAGLLPGQAAENPSQVVDRLLEAYRSGSVDRMMEVYSPDVVFDDISQKHHAEGAQQLREILIRTVAVHQKMGLVEKRRVVEGDTVVVEHEYTGRLDGSVLGKSMGKEEACPDVDYHFPTTSWYRVRDGRIIAHKDFIDLASLMEVREKLLAGTK